MWADRITPLFTLSLSEATHIKPALEALFHILFDDISFDTPTSTTHSKIVIDELVRIIQTFSTLYICRSGELGLQQVTREQVLEVYPHETFYVKPSKRLSMSNLLFMW
jgi:hypothetical protein